MAKFKVKEYVADIAEKICINLGLELVEVEYKKEGKDWFLRVYIYKKSGVSIDDCVDVTKALNEILDKEDPIEGAYILEVSSPGLDRPLRTNKDFERYEGEDVEVSLFAAEDGVKIFEGTLIGKVDGVISIFINDVKKEFAAENVSTVKRTIKF